jgi:hypothetical protein
VQRQESHVIAGLSFNRVPYIQDEEPLHFVPPRPPLCAELHRKYAEAFTRLVRCVQER